MRKKKRICGYRKKKKEKTVPISFVSFFFLSLVVVTGKKKKGRDDDDDVRQESQFFLFFPQKCLIFSNRRDAKRSTASRLFFCSLSGFSTGRAAALYINVYMSNSFPATGHQTLCGTTKIYV